MVGCGFAGSGYFQMVPRGEVRSSGKIYGFLKKIQVVVFSGVVWCFKKIYSMVLSGSLRQSKWWTIVDSCRLQPLKRGIFQTQTLSGRRWSMYVYGRCIYGTKKGNDSGAFASYNDVFDLG